MTDRAIHCPCCRVQLSPSGKVDRDLLADEDLLGYWDCEVCRTQFSVKKLGKEITPFK